MSMTLIAGICGMNFRKMPWLNWGLGHAWALGLMVAVGGALQLYQRSKDWIRVSTLAVAPLPQPSPPPP